MLKKVLVIVGVLTLSLGLISCERLDAEPPKGPLPSEVPKMLDAIPLEHGKLIAITPHGQQPFTAVLWFEKPDKTIVAVIVNYSRGIINPNVLTIPRK